MRFDLRRDMGAVGLALTLVIGTLIATATQVAAAAALPWVSSVSPSTGKVTGGTRLTVTGLHFWDVRSVLFGTTPGTSVRVLSSTKLQVTAPAHSAEVVHIRVRTAAGMSSTHSTDRFTFIAAPKIGSLTPNTSSTGGGARLTIRGSAFVHVTKVLFGTVPGSALRVSSASSLQVTAPPHTAGRVGIRVQTLYGLSHTGTASAFAYVAGPTIASLTPAQGAIGGGTHVIISGSGFLGATHVMFGTTPATSFNVNSNGEIAATAPAQGAGSVNVGVTTPYGTSTASAGDRFTYIGAPTVTYLAEPASGGTGGGTAAHIFGTNFVGTPTVTFDGLPATNVSVLNSTQIDVTAPPHAAGLVDVRVATAYGTSAISAGDRYRYRPSASIALGSPTLVDPPRGGGFPQSVSCPSATFCISIDFLSNVFTYNGTTWSAPSQTAPADLQFVSCPSPTFCAAYGRGGEAATFSGGSWSATAQVDPFGQQAQGLSCPTTTFCAAVDHTGDAITFNPTTLTTLTNSVVLGGDHFQAVSCTSATFCMAVSLASTFIYNGVRWLDGPQITPNAGPYMTDVSCAAPTSCIAVDDHGGALTFDGTSWSTRTVVGTAKLTSISCLSTSRCVAIDAGGNVASFDGSSWTAPAQGHDWTNATWAISCVSTTFCGAVSDWGDVETFDGTDTTYVHDVDSGNGIQSVSCPSTMFCAAVDMAGYATTFNGATWTAPAMVDTAGELVAVSCSSATFCAATDIHGNALTFDGTHWSTPVNVVNNAGSVFYYGKVSCVSATFCIATAPAGTVIKYNGSGWSVPAQIDTSDLVDLSCPTTIFCMATDRAGHYTTFDGTSWTSPATAITYGLFAVSCTSSTFCAATDTAFGAEVYNGAAWTADNGAGQLDHMGYVSCTSPTFCVSTNGGYVTTYDGTAWSMPNYEPLRNAFSCATPTFCMFFDGQGNAIIGQ